LFPWFVSTEGTGSGEEVVGILYNPLEGNVLYHWYITSIYCQLGDYVLPISPLYKHLKNLGGGLKHLIFSPLGEMIQFDDHIFQMGWFNHQLENPLMFWMFFLGQLKVAGCVGPYGVINVKSC